MSNTVDPLARVAAWLDAAERETSRRNPLAMAVATCSRAGVPSVRMVLLRGFAPAPGFFVFYTNYRSRKGAELAANPRAAAVLYWEELGQQLRIEGPVTRSPASESDQYFSHRPLLSQINAWVSAQSQPLDDPATLIAASEAKAHELGLADSDAAHGRDPPTVPRPPHWGGFRIWAEALEFWSEGDHRFLARETYRRVLEPHDDGSYTGSPWTHARLQP